MPSIFRRLGAARQFIYALPRFLFGLRHPDICIIANNCIATYLYKDLGLPYSSPTINLQFTQEGFVLFCRHFNSYVDLPIKECPNPSLPDFQKLGGGVEINFPVGTLGDLILFLQHYQTVEDADAAWHRRSSRINKSKVFFIFMAYDNTDDAVLKQYEALPIQNKLLLTNSDRRNVFPDSHPLLHGKSAWFEKDPRTGSKYYWRFDFIKWMHAALC